MKVLRENHKIGNCVEKIIDQSVDDAQVGMAIFAAIRGISLVDI